VIRAALWSAAVISYRRAFNSGKALGQPQAPRLKIPDDWTKSLKQAQRNAHDEVLVIANKHVAHRVGDHEVGGVRALLAPPPEPREVVGIVSALGHDKPRAEGCSGRVARHVIVSESKPACSVEVSGFKPCVHHRPPYFRGVPASLAWQSDKRHLRPWAASSARTGVEPDDRGNTLLNCGVVFFVFIRED
jgi:hypothetical protein